ncbi:MAG: glycosyltransferase family 2 protein [Burkholderiales bacterium]|nr:glycosyltransferase family 2 protein [Burkholderiales bacterium]
MKLSVVVCVRNEEKRLRECLESVYQNNPDEVILVDGDSADGTLAIAREFPGIQIIESKNSSLPRDRQKGIDAAKNALVAMVDADHRLRVDDLESLLRDMHEFNFDIVQSGLVSHVIHGFWDAAEEASWELTQNIPGRRNMVGVAPAIFNKRVFSFARFDDHITATIEDTDFAYRLSKFPELRFGVGRTKIRQYHFADFSTYVKKFLWYGKGDGEFCRKHPERAVSMLFHLLIRYPFIHSWTALRKGCFRAIPFFALQGGMRFLGLVKYFITAR